MATRHTHCHFVGGAVGEVDRAEDAEGKAKVSQNAYKSGMRPLLRELRRLLRKQDQALEDY